MQLTRGQNTALRATTLRFTATSGTPRDVSALVVDADLRALSSETFVFYNHPNTRGVRLGEGGVEIELHAVHPDAHAVLCIVSVDPLAPPGTVFAGLTASLLDLLGNPVAHFDIDCRAGETAVICWELYRRAGHWKVRAVGQGYADGLAGLIRCHGVDVEDAGDEPTSSTTGATPVPYPPIEPLDPDRILERFGMIGEDAARSAGAVIAAREFAQSRLDSEMTAAVADPSTRNGPAAASARARAQQRHDEVVEQAAGRYRQDSAHLQRELDVITPGLPRSFADWGAPAWVDATAPGRADGIRLGELAAPQCGPLRIPLCLPFPLRQPLLIVGPGTPGTAGVVCAVVLRMLAAGDHLALDVVDQGGNLRILTDALADRRSGATITSVDAVGPYLESVAASAELAMLDGAGVVPAGVSAGRLVVLNHFPYGYEQRHWPLIAFLAQHGPARGVSLVIVTDDANLGEIDPEFARNGHVLPAAEESEWRDPWTFNTWIFTPDRMPADTDRLARVLAHFRGR